MPLLQARRALGIKDDIFSFSALVTAAGKAGNVQLLTEALRTAQAANACNVAVCNAAIEAFSRVGAAQVSSANNSIFILMMKQNLCSSSYLQYLV